MDGGEGALSPSAPIPEPNDVESSYGNLNRELFRLEPHAILRNNLPPLEVSGETPPLPSAPPPTEDIPCEGQMDVAGGQQLRPLTEQQLFGLCKGQKAIEGKSQAFEDKFLLEVDQQSDLELVLDFHGNVTADQDR